MKVSLDNFDFKTEIIDVFKSFASHVKTILNNEIPKNLRNLLPLEPNEDYFQQL